MINQFCNRIYLNTLPAFVTYYYCYKDNRMKSVCCLPYGFDLDDFTLLHELNHVVTASLIDNNKKCFVFKSGTDKSIYFNNDCDYAYKTAVLKNYQKSSKIIDEVITDYISIDLQKQLEKDGIIISSTKYNKSTYASAFGLLDKFLTYNKQYLKEFMISPVYLNPNQQFINFDELDELANHFVKNIVYAKETQPILKEISQKEKNN